MSVTDGEKADQTTFNNAFGSRTTDTSISSKWSLENTDPESGATVANIQQRLNENHVAVTSILTVNANGQITLDAEKRNHVVLVVGDGSDQNINLIPFTNSVGTSDEMLDGAKIKIIGTNDAQAVTFKDNKGNDYGCVLNGDAKLVQYSTLDLIYVRALKRFIEDGRSI